MTLAASRIIAGPFADFVACIATLADSHRVYALLDLLGREVLATIAAGALVPD
jgi:transcription antitermination factor NusG